MMETQLYSTKPPTACCVKLQTTRALPSPTLRGTKITWASPTITTTSRMAVVKLSVAHPLARLGISSLIHGSLSWPASPRNCIVSLTGLMTLLYWSFAHHPQYPSWSNANLRMLVICLPWSCLWLSSVFVLTPSTPRGWTEKSAAYTNIRRYSGLRRSTLRIGNLLSMVIIIHFVRANPLLIVLCYPTCATCYLRRLEACFYSHEMMFGRVIELRPSPTSTLTGFGKWFFVSLPLNNSSKSFRRPHSRLRPYSNPIWRYLGPKSSRGTRLALKPSSIV